MQTSKLSPHYFLLLTAFISILHISCQQENKVEKAPLYPKQILQLSPEKAKALAQQIRTEVAAQVAEGLELSLWASDSLVSDPVAISIDPQGHIYYTSGVRLEHSEFDIRGHRDWMTASISFQSVEDRREFLRETFATENSTENTYLEDLNQDSLHDWRDLTVEKEEVWRVMDTDGDGLADQSQLYIKDFHEEITDLANGVEVHDGEVYIAVGPDLWRTKDEDGDGIGDTKESISHGYAVHIGFGAHGMSGVTVGPDGRIWWGIGDIGMNVVDQTGKQWKYPNQGVIVRSEPDGSNFEVFAAGLRNTHEFVFDQYGNLITEDNDGDHAGERERLVYVTEGSDGGWRSNWQFGKYTDPDNNDYKVWMAEKLHTPRWEGQAAYITPPIQNYINGPTGMVYNPGTALGEEWYDHFFIAEFRGSASNSPIHAFTLQANGASFEMTETKEVVSGLLPTGLDFGPDGALYFGDWIIGWGVKNLGRMWKLDLPGGAQTAIRQDTKKMMQADYHNFSDTELGEILKHQDMRVRLKAQFELAKRGESSATVLLAAAEQKAHQLARIHGLWGIGQLSRQDIKHATLLQPFLQDEDPEIQAQAAKLIGDVRYTTAAKDLIPLLKHDSLRVQFFGAEALGRIAYEPAIPAILEMLERNNDQDAWLRHAGVLALARIGQTDLLIDLASHESKALRTAAVVALRRMKEPDIAIFLKDKDPFIVLETARAIHDDFSIPAALPYLAELLNTTTIQDEVLIRRAISANLRIGKFQNLEHLKKYAIKKDAPMAMRQEAIAVLGVWPKPSVLDRVDGRLRGVMIRDAKPVKAAVADIMQPLFEDSNDTIKIAIAETVGRLELEAAAPILLNLFKTSPVGAVRLSMLNALIELKDAQLRETLDVALTDEDQTVRSGALSGIAKADLSEEQIVTLLSPIFETSSVTEQQAALKTIGTISTAAAAPLLKSLLERQAKGDLSAAIQLDLAEVVIASDSEILKQQLADYEATQDNDFVACLEGGNRGKGQHIFYNHEAAQCVRCHSLGDYGGDVGPSLTDLAKRLSKAEILESLVEPSASIAAGYGTVVLTLKNEEVLSGILKEENEQYLVVELGEGKQRNIAKKEIIERINANSSMPPVSAMLGKREIRDLVAFLASLD